MSRKPPKSRLSRVAVGEYGTCRKIGELMEKHVAATCKFSQTREEFLRSFIDAGVYDTLKAAAKYGHPDLSREISLRITFLDNTQISARIFDAGILTPAADKIRLSNVQEAMLSPLRDALDIGNRYRALADVALAFYNQDVTPSAVAYHWPAGTELIFPHAPEPRWAPFEYDLAKLRETVTLLATARLLEGVAPPGPRGSGLYVRSAIAAFTDAGFTIPFADSVEDAK